MDLPDELKECLVPKQILQPLIENSIIHGLEGRENGRVMIQASQIEGQEETLLQILVRDDGVGMTQEEVERLNHCEETQVNREDKHSIGFFNVNEIIRLNYGPAYGLHAVSRQGEGTSVYVILPVRTDKDPVSRVQ